MQLLHEACLGMQKGMGGKEEKKKTNAKRQLDCVDIWYKKKSSKEFRQNDCKVFLFLYWGVAWIRGDWVVAYSLLYSCIQGTRSI